MSPGRSPCQFLLAETAQVENRRPIGVSSASPRMRDLLATEQRLAWLRARRPSPVAKLSPKLYRTILRLEGAEGAEGGAPDPLNLISSKSKSDFVALIPMNWSLSSVGFCNPNDENGTTMWFH